MSRAEISASTAHERSPAHATTSGAATRTPLAWSTADSAVLVGFAAVALGVFALLRARVLNLPGYIDPWIYTAFFRNWDYVYRVFGDTYYPTRLPYLIPGYFVNQVLPPVPAFYVLHWGYLVFGAACVYLILRRFYGRLVGAIGYAAALTNVLYYGSHINDYYDGAVIAYLLAGLYFILTARGSRRYRLRMTTGGFFLWGAATTNLFASIPVVCMAVVYTCVYWPDLRRRTLATLGADSGLLLVGAAAMTCAGGIFSVVKGGRFFYIINQIHVLGTLDLAPYKIHGYGWLKQQPQLLVPFFLLVTLALLLRRRLLARWSEDPAVRLAVGSIAYLSLLFGILGVWEFAFSGVFFDIPYYFSYVLTGFVLCLGATVWAAFRSGPEDLRVAPVVLAALGGLAAVTPAVLVSHGIAGHRFFTVEYGSVIAVVLLIAGLVAVALRRALPRASLAMGASIVLLVLGVNFASAAARSGYENFQSTPTTRAESHQALALGMDLIAFLERSGVQNSDTAPGFWYDADPMLGSIQSLYLWQSTWIGQHMPAFGAEERRLLESRRPENLVLLCDDRPCAGAPQALRQAGYVLRPVASTLLASGSRRVWVQVYALPKYANQPKAKDFFTSIQTPLVRPPTGMTITTWSFAHGVPSDFQSHASSVAPSGTGLSVTTTKGRFAYQLEGTPQTLPAGVYTAALQGRVLTGGLTLGILDAKADRWIAQSPYSSTQRGFDEKVMAVTFSLNEPTDVQIILTNIAPHDMTSSWRLYGLDLLQTK